MAALNASLPTAPSTHTDLHVSSPCSLVHKIGPSKSPEQWTRSDKLRKIAHAFCMALVSPEFDAYNFISHFFVEGDAATITEHGPGWARKNLPFLGQKFQGRDGLFQYFTELNKTLNILFDSDAFPPDEELIVDPDCKVEGGLKGCVCVVGKGKFENKVTEWTWEEKFIYKLSGFDEDLRVTHWVSHDDGNE